MNNDVQLWLENQNLRKQIAELNEQVEALQAMLQAAPPLQRHYITRPCSECGELALFDPLTTGPALCIDHRRRQKKHDLNSG